MKVEVFYFLNIYGFLKLYSCGLNMYNIKLEFYKWVYYFNGWEWKSSKCI